MADVETAQPEAEAARPAERVSESWLHLAPEGRLAVLHAFLPRALPRLAERDRAALLTALREAPPAEAGPAPEPIETAAEVLEDLLELSPGEQRQALEGCAARVVAELAPGERATFLRGLTTELGLIEASGAEGPTVH